MRYVLTLLKLDIKRLKGQYRLMKSSQRIGIVFSIVILLMEFIVFFILMIFLGESLRGKSLLFAESTLRPILSMALIYSSSMGIGYSIRITTKEDIMCIFLNCIPDKSLLIERLLVFTFLANISSLAGSALIVAFELGYRCIGGLYSILLLVSYCTMMGYLGIIAGIFFLSRKKGHMAIGVVSFLVSVLPPIYMLWNKIGLTNALLMSLSGKINSFSIEILLVAIMFDVILLFMSQKIYYHVLPFIWASTSKVIKHRRSLVSLLPLEPDVSAVVRKNFLYLKRTPRILVSIVFSCVLPILYMVLSMVTPEITFFFRILAILLLVTMALQYPVYGIGMEKKEFVLDLYIAPKTWYKGYFITTLLITIPFVIVSVFFSPFLLIPILISLIGLIPLSIWLALKYADFSPRSGKGVTPGYGVISGLLEIPFLLCIYLVLYDYMFLPFSIVELSIGIVYYFTFSKKAMAEFRELQITDIIQK